MNTAGYLRFDTKLDTKGFQKGMNDITNKTKSGGGTIKNIVAGLGITKLIGMALNTIKDSLDGAISRFDTLNNYPKVMENLGISTKEAEKSIQKLSEGITGLPTTLDSAALAVEKFTSANGDVKKSTDLFLALNNAIVAGGASTQIQESAMEQLSQAYAKGKPDMMEWRALQTAMPGQLKQVAMAMGYAGGNVTQLGEDLRKGNVSMDDFMETIVKLNKDGLPGFKSFADQAQDAVGGIGTSVTNAKTAIVRGVTTMITTLNSSMKKAGVGTIAENISKLGKMAEKALKNVGKTLSKIPFEKIIKYMKAIIKLIASIVAGMIAYNGVMKAMKIATFIKDITATIKALTGLTKAAELSASAMKLFQAASSMSYVGLAIAAVAGLTAGLVLLYKTVQKNNNEYLEAEKSLKQYNQSMKEASEARQEYLDTNMVEIKSSEDLVNELSLIVDKNGKVKDGYEDRAKFIVGELNEALGLEIKMTDGVIQNYSKLENSVNKVIKAKRAQVLMEAQEKEYDEAIKQRETAEKRYGDAVKSTQEKIKEKNKFLNEMHRLYGVNKEDVQQFLENKMSDISISEEERRTYYNLLKQYNKYDDAVAKATDNQKKQYKAWEDNERIITEYETALGYLKDKNYDAILKMYQDTTNYSGMTKNEVTKDLEARKLAMEQYLRNVENDQSISDEKVKKSLISSGKAKLDEINKQLSEQKKATEEGQNKISQTWNDTLAKQLSALTGAKIEFKKTSKGQIQAYINGVKEGKPMSQKEAEKFGKDMAKEIDKSKGKSKEAGKNLVEGTTRGIKDKKSQNSAFNAVENFGKQLLAKLKKSLKEKSPSKETYEMGKYLDEGLILGIENEKKDVLKSASQLGQDVIDRMKGAVALETGNINASASLKANANYNNVMVANIQVESDMYMDRQKVGQAVTPVVSKTLKKAGV